MFLKIIHKSKASFICILIRKEVILNLLEYLLALNVCVQNLPMSEIIVEDFKIEQSRKNSDLCWQYHFNK